MMDGDLPAVFPEYDLSTRKEEIQSIWQNQNSRLFDIALPAKTEQTTERLKAPPSLPRILTLKKLSNTKKQIFQKSKEGSY